MDPESPTGRVERTLWTVWYYITGAVNRFFRASPTDTINGDPNSFQETTDHIDPPDCREEEDGSVRRRVLDEEQPVAKVSPHSSSVVTSSICTADIHFKPDDESAEHRKPLSRGSEDGEGTREEELGQTGNDDTGPLTAEDDTAKEQDSDKIITLYACGQDEKNEGQRVSTDNKSEEESEGKTGTEEEEEDGQNMDEAMTEEEEEDGQNMDEAMTEEEEGKMLHEDEQLLDEEDSDVMEIRPEEQDSMHRGQIGDAVTVETEEDSENCDVVLHKSETGEVEKQPAVCEELPDMSKGEPVVTGQEHPMGRSSESEDECEQGTVTEEEEGSDAAQNQQTDEMSEQERDVREKNMLTECVTCSEEGVQNAEEEGVADTEMQTRTRNSKLEERTEQETFPCEESPPEAVCSSTSVTVTLETGQEIREFKNTSLGTSEGHVVMLQEVNTPTCEETQEGVPEYNNELRPDENPTQKILEEGDCEEIQTIQLPEEEEEEEEEEETIEKGGCTTEADSLLVTELMEDNQESTTEEIGDNFEDTERQSVRKESQESGHVSEEEEEEGRFQEGSMKTTEEVLVDFGTHEVLYDSKDAAEEVCDVKEEVGVADEKIQMMPEKSFFDEPGQAMAAEQNNIRTFEGDMINSEFLKHSGEKKHELLDEIRNAMLDTEERDHGDEIQKKNKQVVDSEVSLHLEIHDQSAGIEMSEKEMIKDTEAPDESNTSQSIIEESVTEMEASPGHQDVIDEEILDLWIETALSEDAHGNRQREEAEQEEQMDAEASPDLSYEEQMSPKKEPMESNSGESALASDGEISLSTVESEFLDQSLGECGTQNSELLKPMKSFQGLDDLSESADISELPAQQASSESQDDLMEGRAEAEQSYLKEEHYPDSGVSSPLNEESDKSQESREENGSQRDVEVTDMGGAEEPDMTKMRPLQENKVSDEILVSDFSDEITHIEFRSETVEGEITSNEGASQGDVWPEMKLDGPEPGWLEEPVEMYQDLNEVDVSLLDFTVQKSRIAVKNPLVRPPKDPRTLLNMPSADPTPSPRAPAAGVPLGGLNIGIKLPGFGAGFPVLKKTHVDKDEKNQEMFSQQETEKKTEETSEAPKQDEVQHKPKWMPPRHPGFGNPLMSELKTKLKKTTKE